MKLRHHFWSSVAAGGALYWATGSGSAIAGAMIGGFLIDLDHVLDQGWSIYRGAPKTKTAAKNAALAQRLPVGLGNLFERYVQRRKLTRLPLVFHSYELLVVLALAYTIIRSPFLLALVIGYALHLTLDLIRHHDEFQSPFFYFLSYRASRGFKREKLIKHECL